MIALGSTATLEALALRAVRALRPSLASWLLAIVAVLALLLAGCGAPPGTERAPSLFASLAGEDDVELTYEVVGAAPPVTEAAFGQDLRALVLRRLGAARIGADVVFDERRLRIVVDEDLAQRVDELVTWTGALSIFEADPSVRLASRDPSSGLVAREDGADHWYEGARGDVLRAIETWPIDRDHRIVAEPIWMTASGRDPPRWRTRVVRAAPVAELADGALVAWGAGPTLRVRAMPGSPAEAVLREARTRPGAILTRGRISLGTPSWDGDAMVLSFGAGAEAYARAAHERQLLMTPRLPPLRRVDAVGLPPNRLLATACLVVPIVLSLAWLVFVRRFDRAHPEPLWLVGVTFVLGALATMPAGIAEWLLATSTPWLDPELATFGGRAFALPLGFVVFTVVVGMSEEGAKRAAAQFAARRREFDEPVDGIIYGIVASLGFAAAENVRYFALGRLTAPLVIARCFMSVPAHMFFGAIWGYALGKRLVAPRTRAWAWLLFAAACHGLFDALLSTEGAGGLAVLLNVGLASVFVALVRRSLRHGIVTKEVLAIRPEDRALFRVGRPRLFWTSAVLLHVLAAGIFFLGAYYQLARHRPGLAFVLGSSAMLAMLAVAAYGLVATLPLDVAIDDYGVTFAGAARPWRKIRGFRTHDDRVELDCEGGPILLGPAPRPTIDALVAALEARLGKDGKERLVTLESRA